MSMSDRNICRWCGREFERDRGFTSTGASRGNIYCGLSCYRSASNAKKEDSEALKASIAAMRAANEERKNAKLARKEAKADRKYAIKEQKKAEKNNKAEITSEYSLENVKKLSIVCGYVGVHRLMTGRRPTGILMAVLFIFAIYDIIIVGLINHNPGSVSEGFMFLLIDMMWWGVDILTIISKRYRDGSGHTVRE